MLTGKLFAGLAGLLLVFAVLYKLHRAPPVPFYMQLVVALSSVIFASTFFARRKMDKSFSQSNGGVGTVRTPRHLRLRARLRI